MHEREDIRFVSVGQPFARDLEPRVRRRARLTVPFSTFETYPASMTLFDVALAPAGRTNFYRGKSDLRWLEASALGMPLIADPGRLSRASSTASPASTPRRPPRWASSCASWSPTSRCGTASARRRAHTSASTAALRSPPGSGRGPFCARSPARAACPSRRRQSDERPDRRRRHGDVQPRALRPRGGRLDFDAGHPSDRLQFVIVDNGSTDSTPDILREYADRTEIHCIEPLTVNQAANLGLARLSTDYFTVFSGDDVWKPGRLAHMLEIMERRPDVGLLCGDKEIIDGDGNLMAPSAASASGIGHARRPAPGQADGGQRGVRPHDAHARHAQAGADAHPARGRLGGLVVRGDRGPHLTARLHPGDPGRVPPPRQQHHGSHQS